MKTIQVVVTAMEQNEAQSCAGLERLVYKKLVDAGIPMKGFWRVARGRLEQHEYSLNGCVVYTWTDEEAK
jgi:hypothetical protein